MDSAWEVSFEALNSGVLHTHRVFRKPQRLPILTMVNFGAFFASSPLIGPKSRDLVVGTRQPLGSSAVYADFRSVRLPLIKKK